MEELAELGEKQGQEQREEHGEEQEEEAVCSLPLGQLQPLVASSIRCSEWKSVGKRSRQSFALSYFALL